jgi:hypothetical protein
VEAEGPTVSSFVLDSDVLYPRNDEERYRLYGLRGKALDVLATCGDLEAVGVAVGQLHEDAKAVGGVFGDSGSFGLLDSVAGEWIVNPFRPKATA